MTSMEMSQPPEINIEDVITGIQQQLVEELHDNTPATELTFIEQFSVLPEYNQEQRNSKSRGAINAMRALLLATFDGSRDPESTARHTAQFELIDQLAESNMFRLGKDPESPNIAFITDSYDKWTQAAQLAQENSRSFSAATDVVDEYLAARQRFMRGEITPSAFAEGSVGNAIAAAFGGPEFTREAGIMASAALEEDKKVFEATEQRMLSAGDDYILGGILRNANLLTNDHLKDGSSLQIDALEGLATMEPWQMHQYLMLSHNLERASTRHN